MGMEWSLSTFINIACFDGLVYLQPSLQIMCMHACNVHIQSTAKKQTNKQTNKKKKQKIQNNNKKNKPKTKQKQNKKNPIINKYIIIIIK